jgi:Holliday junction DNA helicase RuvA
VIASLAGQVERLRPGEVVVNVGGVGYRVHVPLSTFESLPVQGRDCWLRIVTVVRDDEISLYGFMTGEEEDLFRLLQSVSGVGPKLALKILSGMSASSLRAALASGDHRLLQGVPGVGKKLAQRLMVELRDKVRVTAPDAGAAPMVGDDVEIQALQALEVLGYPRKTAEQALKSTRGEGTPTLEARIREALRALAPKR